MKKTLSILLVLVVLLIAGSVSYAGGCRANCTFSSCEIGGVDSWACGCYFGFAICKGERVKASVNKAAISDFGSFANNSGYDGLVRLSGILYATNEYNYESQRDLYQVEVENLDEEERAMLIAYLGGIY